MHLTRNVRFAEADAEEGQARDAVAAVPDVDVPAHEAAIADGPAALHVAWTPELAERLRAFSLGRPPATGAHWRTISVTSRERDPKFEVHLPV